MPNKTGYNIGFFDKKKPMPREKEKIDWLKATRPERQKRNTERTKKFSGVIVKRTK